MNLRRLEKRNLNGIDPISGVSTIWVWESIKSVSFMGVSSGVSKSYTRRVKNLVDFGGRNSIFDLEFESMSTRNTVPFDFLEWNSITVNSIFPRFVIAYTELSANPCFSNETPSTSISFIGSSSSHVPRGDRCETTIGKCSDFPRESSFRNLVSTVSPVSPVVSIQGNSGNSMGGRESS